MWLGFAVIWRVVKKMRTIFLTAFISALLLIRWPSGLGRCVSPNLYIFIGVGSRGGMWCPVSLGGLVGKGHSLGRDILNFIFLLMFITGAVFDLNSSCSVLACFRIMGDHDNGLALTV